MFFFSQPNRIIWAFSISLVVKIMLKEKTESREVNGSQSPEAEKKLLFCGLSYFIVMFSFERAFERDFDFKKKRVSERLLRSRWSVFSSQWIYWIRDFARSWFVFHMNMLNSWSGQIWICFVESLMETLWRRSSPRHSDGNVNNNNNNKRFSDGSGSTTLNINNKTTNICNQTNQTNNKLITNIRSTKSSFDLRLDSWTNNNKPNPTKVSKSLPLAQNSTTIPLNETPPLPTGPHQDPSPSQKSLSKAQNTSKASGFVPKITISYPSVESQGSIWSKKSNNQVSYKIQFLNLTINNQLLLI